MSRRQTLLAIGILIILIQPSGFPDAFRKTITAALGVALIGTSYFMKREESEEREISTPVFSESRKESVIQHQ